MLPVSYELPVAVALVIGGAITCIAGYRLFRMVLAIYGFIVGAMLASSVMASSNAFGMVVAALVGGVIGSLVLFFAYFAGIALVGAGLGALITHLAWAQWSAADPPVVIVVLFVALGTIVALVLQRYVIILSTAFSGAWTLIVGALALNRGSLRRSATDVWIFYPFTPAAEQRWIVLAWIVLGLVGTAVQLVVTGRKR
jgi:Domain of unknown function (DUF4203)